VEFELVAVFASLRIVAELSQGTRSATKCRRERDLFLLSFDITCTIFQLPLIWQLECRQLE
jgi:hypothetical protein